MRKNSNNRVLQEINVMEPYELLDFLIEKNIRKSRSAIKSLLVHKQITVNGKLVTQFDFKLKPKDTIKIMNRDQTKKEKKLLGLKIMYEDDHLIVIDKESNFLTVPTDKEKFKTIHNVLNEYAKKKRKLAHIFVVHRMDREVSGLMVFAKDEETQDLLQRNWDLLILNYTYMAVIEGRLAKDKGTITSWLTENKNFMVFSSPQNNGGMEAITHYEILKSNERYSLIKFNQATRRKNQIRAQMQQMQCPIAGDKKYGATTTPLKRIVLHGESMTLKHPITGEKMEFKSPLTRPMIQLTNTNNIKE